MHKGWRDIGSVLTALCLAAGLAWPAHAQESDSNQPRERQGLPEIAPREMEIRGRINPALPTLQRQPITGFAVPEVMYQIPEDRTPHAETYAEAELEQSPLRRPDLPDATTLASAPPIQGEVEASAGRYLSRLLRAYASAPLSPSATASARLRYEGMSGYEPETVLPGSNADFDDFEGQATAQALLGTVALGGDVDGFSRSHAAFGAKLGNADADQRPTPELNAAGAGASLWLRSHGRTRTDLQTRLRFDGARFETEEGANAVTRSDQGVALSARLLTPLPGGDLLANAEMGGRSLSGGGANEGASHYILGGGYRFQYRRRFSITLGAAALGYGVRYGEEADRSDVSDGYISPLLAVELSPTTGMRVYAQNRPGVEAHSLASILEKSPYLVPLPEVQPTIRTIDAEAGASVFMGRLQLSGRAGFQSMPNYLFFEQEEETQNGSYARLIAPGYERARIGYVGGDVSLVLPGSLQATVGGRLRDGVLENPDGQDWTIPYFGAMTGYTTLSVPFAKRRGLLQLVGTYESARRVSRATSRRVGDFFDLDAALSFDLTSQLGFITRVENISANRLERWDWYPQAPLTIMGGVQVEW